jgi:hypothetical protein
LRSEYRIGIDAYRQPAKHADWTNAAALFRPLLRRSVDPRNPWADSDLGVDLVVQPIALVVA